MSNINKTNTAISTPKTVLTEEETKKQNLRKVALEALQKFVALYPNKRPNTSKLLDEIWNCKNLKMEIDTVYKAELYAKIIVNDPICKTEYVYATIKKRNKKVTEIILKTLLFKDTIKHIEIVNGYYGLLTNLIELMKNIIRPVTLDISKSYYLDPIVAEKIISTKSLVKVLLPPAGPITVEKNIVYLSKNQQNISLTHKINQIFKRFWQIMVSIKNIYPLTLIKRR